MLRSHQAATSVAKLAAAANATLSPSCRHCRQAGRCASAAAAVAFVSILIAVAVIVSVSSGGGGGGRTMWDFLNWVRPHRRR